MSESIKIKDAPTTTPKATLKIPVGNAGDDQAHSITLSALKDWLLSEDSGGLVWGEILNKPLLVGRGELATVNGQSLLTGGNVTVEADTIQWSKVINKPAIPQKTSDLINDANFLTKPQADTFYNEKLISGRNIATINGYNMLDGGNIVIEGSEQKQADWSQTDLSQVDYIKHKPSIVEPPQVIVLKGAEGEEGIWQVTIDSLKTNTIYLCQNVTRVAVENIPDNFNSPLPTRIYLQFPHKEDGTKETLLQLTLPTAYPTLGELFGKQVFSQAPDFPTFCVEFANGYAEAKGLKERS